jgi:hypothetical protein
LTTGSTTSCTCGPSLQPRFVSVGLVIILRGTHTVCVGAVQQCHCGCPCCPRGPAAGPGHGDRSPSAPAAGMWFKLLHIHAILLSLLHYSDHFMILIIILGFYF